MEGPNPYAAPIGGARPPTMGEHESTRRAHFNTEINIKAIGALAIAGAALGLMSGIRLVIELPIAGTVTLAMTIAAGFAGLMLRSLAPIGRVVLTVLIGTAAANSLYAYSQTTDVGALLPLFFPMLFLLVLWGRSGRVVFSEHYRTVVIPATPQVQYKMSPVLVVLLMLLAFAVFAIAFMIITGTRM